MCIYIYIYIYVCLCLLSYMAVSKKPGAKRAHVKPLPLALPLSFRYPSVMQVHCMLKNPPP